MIVHGANGSPFVRKVRVSLEEKGIGYEHKNLIPFPKTDELLAMHPMGKIPILEHQGRFIPDSSVICAYLEKLQPEARLYPEQPAEFARALFLEEYADTRAVDAVGPIVFETIVKPNVYQQETDHERVEKVLREDVPPVLDYFQSQLEYGAATLLSRFSIADVSVASHLAGLYITQHPVDDQRWPVLAAYMERMLNRPSFKAAMDG